jgi:hypothetical protein
VKVIGRSRERALSVNRIKDLQSFERDLCHSVILNETGQTFRFDLVL